MKKYFLFIILFVSSIVSVNFCYAQGIAVNTTGNTADPSAMLDINATNKGVLVPRMALSDRNVITSPATGLLIYQTDNTPGFYYNAGTSTTPNWTLLGATGPTGPTGPTGSNGSNGSNGAGFSNGTSAGQVYLTGGSPFAPQSPQSVTGDVTINSVGVTSYNNVVPANKGGAGAVNGILAANGAGTVSAASTTGFGSVVLASGTTGTGSAVLASSPTLVLPILGTPQSGNAINLTNLNASQLTSGTVPVTALPIVPIANGGTGTTSPALVAGSNVTITGSWPNQTINASFPSIITPPTALTSITTTPAYQTMKSITFPSAGYYLVSAFINITSQQANDEYHAKITQGGTILTGTTDYYAAEGLLSMSTVVNTSSGITVLIQCDNSNSLSGSAVGSYSVVKLSN